jgi:hypothetical protein
LIPTKCLPLLRTGFSDPVDGQSLIRVTNLNIRELVSNYRVFDRGFLGQKHFRTQSLPSAQRKKGNSQSSVLTGS